MTDTIDYEDDQNIAVTHFPKGHVPRSDALLAPEIK